MMITALVLILCATALTVFNWWVLTTNAKQAAYIRERIEQDIKITLELGDAVKRSNQEHQEVQEQLRQLQHSTLKLRHHDN